MNLHKFSFLILLSTVTLFSKGMPKEYFEIKAKKKVKEYFFEYIYKLSESENKKILQERNIVKSILNSNILRINTKSENFSQFLKIKKKYRIKKLYDLKSYLSKIDTIPPALCLAQAAVESGWGKSRFIAKANNIFGHWTYNPNIGIVPERRNEGDRHLIRVFKSLQDSISAYMLNLIEYGKTKDRTISFLKEEWKLSNETIKKGYELQLTMPGLPRRYKGGI